MSAKKNPPGATGGQNDQQGGGSDAMFPQRSAVAHCRPYAARGDFGRYWVIVVTECPNCGRQHAHGGGDGLSPFYGYQVAPCDPTCTAGYWLQPVEAVA